jgi:3-(3-hydroxy-phenyl)propionate hydroxylase
MLMPGDDPQTIVRPENVWPLIERWVTPADARLERSAVYTFHSVMARDWRAGPLLIAGDAAHQTPPFLGQGLCAGIRDAANLAWKLERVTRGAAPPSLLDTYASERKPHVQAFIDLAVQLGAIIQTTDPQQAAERDRRFLAGDARVFEFPSPALGPGLHAGAHGGTLCPQPRIANGDRLDHRVGYGFAVVADPAFMAGIPSPVRARWQRDWADASATWIEAPGAALLRWLAEHEAQAAIIRPDRYLLGTATTVDELSVLGEMMPARRAT